MPRSGLVVIDRSWAVAGIKRVPSLPAAPRRVTRLRSYFAAALIALSNGCRPADASGLPSLRSAARVVVCWPRGVGDRVTFGGRLNTRAQPAPKYPRAHGFSDDRVFAPYTIEMDAALEKAEDKEAFIKQLSEGERVTPTRPEEF